MLECESCPNLTAASREEIIVRQQQILKTVFLTNKRKLGHSKDEQNVETVTLMSSTSQATEETQGNVKKLRTAEEISTSELSEAYLKEQSERKKGKARPTIAEEDISPTKEVPVKCTTREVLGTKDKQLDHDCQPNELDATYAKFRAEMEREIRARHFPILEGTTTAATNDTNRPSSAGPYPRKAQAPSTPRVGSRDLTSNQSTGRQKVSIIRTNGLLNSAHGKERKSPLLPYPATDGQERCTSGVSIEPSAPMIQELMTPHIPANIPQTTDPQEDGALGDSAPIVQELDYRVLIDVEVLVTTRGLDAAKVIDASPDGSCIKLRLLTGQDRGQEIQLSLPEITPVQPRLEVGKEALVKVLDGKHAGQLGCLLSVQRGHDDMEGHIRFFNGTEVILPMPLIAKCCDE